ncbi:Condensin complex subunit 1 [Mycena kentingensis (nom. inval.)]|nr:Condensin complex subunit 1 [Mycena kentingensis (nom. inval.)]
MAFELRDHITALQNIDDYEFNSLDIDDSAALLEGAVEAVAESSEAITEQDVFDVYRNLLKHSDAVPGPVMSKLLDSLLSGLQGELDATTRDEQEPAQIYAAHRTPLEMYAFLLQWFVTAAEKVKQSDGDAPATPAKTRKPRGGKAPAKSRATTKKSTEWTWVDQIPGMLSLLSKVLRLSSQRIWTTTAERDTFISCLTRPAYHITESEIYMKSGEIRMGVYTVICRAVKHHGHGLSAQIAIIQGLQFFEHLSEPMAECLDILVKDYDHAQLCEQILREVAGMTFSAQDSKGPRTFSKFLTKLSELRPRVMLKQMSLLLGQLDSESYPMRIAMVEIMAALIQDLALNSPDEEADNVKKQTTGLYEILLERALDTASYVRTKVLASLTRLCEIKRNPEQRIAITEVAVGALEDKVATVRKNAVALLVALMLTHPYGKYYGGHLDISIWEPEYKKAKAEFAALEAQQSDKQAIQEQPDEEGETQPDEEGGDTEPDDDDNEPDNSMDVDGEDGDDSPRKKKRKAPKLKPRKSQIAADLTQERVAREGFDMTTFNDKRGRMKYHAEALNFIRLLDGTLETMVKLLGSKSKAEVLEAMEHVDLAFTFSTNFASQFGIKKMLHLIWSKESGNPTSEDGQELKGIRQRLLECYKYLYFDPVPDLEPRKQVQRITKNMIERTTGATLAELTSLEEMMRIMMEDDQVHPDIINQLWKVYSTDRTIPAAQRQGAIMILGMLALARRSVVADHVPTLIKIGLVTWGRADPKLARYTFVALQRLNGSAKKVKGSLEDKTIRLEMNNPVFRHLQDAVEHKTRSKEWFGMAEQAINTVYALGDHPDILCNSLIKNLTRRAFTAQTPPADAENVPPPSQEEVPPPTQEEEAPAKDPDAMEEDHPGNMSQVSDGASMPGPTKSADMGDTFALCQLLFVVGHVAIKHIVYLELVEREWKRQKDVKDGVEKQLNAKNKEREELDAVAGNAEDEIGERIAGVRETELLYGPNSLLAIYGPMLVRICGSPSKYKNRTLRATATLSLSKFLCVSSQFCDQNHLLLFKLLEISKSPVIRSNIVIALGDVAVSFSSIIDENSNELYKGLSDDNLVVKKNTLMVLTHLILNGMIKVKGQLGEMAKCIEDSDQRISDLAKLFFKELSTKDNAIYNNLPDVISHLGIGEHAVDEEMFQRTLTYIFSFIEKEKQAESIVEKLCQRFQISETERQWRDIAFCLSLLPFKSERSVKKLIEGLPFYRDKLHEETVFERFTEILTKESALSNKSPNKPDTELAEFEQILEEHRAQGEEDRNLEKRAQGKKAAAKKKASKRSEFG